MQNEILYMLAIVVVGFAVNFALRALPFLLFAGRDRALPRWIVRASDWISPVIIAGLVIYAYAGLSWHTPGPLVAGVVTVALQLWKRNPLMSIIAGTVIYMLFINLGCTSSRAIELDARHPAVEVKTTGVYFGQEPVGLAEVPEIFEKAGVSKQQTIHILLDGEVKDLTEARRLMGVLAKSGYTRPILVTRRHAESEVIDPAKRKKAAASTAAKPKKSAGKRVIRYKKATE